MLLRLLKYSVKNILRNKFLSVSSVLVLTLLMFFINILFILQDVSFKVIDNINSKLTISLYLQDKYDRNSIEVIDLRKDISAMSNSIVWEYKTKDEVLESLRQKDPDLVKILERSNPLPSTITLSNIDIKEYDNLNKLIENKFFILEKNELEKWHFSNYTTQYEKIASVIKVLQAGQVGLYIIISVFFVSIAIIIYSIIWNFIYYYKDEIYITRLVWWSKQFIYWPFVLQWIIYSVISFLLSFIVFVIILQNISYVFSDLYMYKISFSLILLKLFLFIIIWWASWYFSSKKYFK